MSGSTDAGVVLVCPALVTPSNPPASVPPQPGCACTRRPGTSNSYLCPMGVNQFATAVIGPAGGILSFSGQQSPGTSFELDIPPGALDRAIQVTITETSVPPPDAYLDFSPVYLLEPRGLQLGKIARVNVPFGSNIGYTPKQVAIYQRPESSPCEFHALVDSVDTGEVEEASLTEFGYFFVGIPWTALPAACSPAECASGADASSGTGGMSPCQSALAGCSQGACP